MPQNEKYNNLFTIEERKRIIAQTISAIRKEKGLSQKEVAAAIGVSQSTYSAYEKGRNEPPAENLVRMSYVFECPVDILVQRDRIYRDLQELSQIMQQYQAELEQLSAELDEAEGDNQNTKVLVETMQQLIKAMNIYSQTESVQKAINIPGKD